jgi:GNAT superfamily N-acetyltransferase
LTLEFPVRYRLPPSCTTIVVQVVAKLVEMDKARLRAWLVVQTREYAEEMVASGIPPSIANERVRRQTENVFPGGLLAEGHHVYVVDVNGEQVGSLWLGPHPEGNPDSIWVFKIEIEPDRRGQGNGRTAMQLAEEQARLLGGSELGLNVFGFNHVARSLYDSLGYEPTSISMRKKLRLGNSANC